MTSKDRFQSLFIQVQDLRPTSLAYEVHTLTEDKLQLKNGSTRMVQGCHSLSIEGNSISPVTKWNGLHCEIIMTDLASYLVPKDIDGVTKIGSLSIDNGDNIKGIIQIKPAIMRDILDYFRFPLVVDGAGKRIGVTLMRLDISNDSINCVDGEKYCIYRLSLEDN